MPSQTQNQMQRLAAGSATAFLLAVLCVYPLYIDRFSNLGLIKFTGGGTLLLAFSFWLGMCAVIGTRAPAGRWQGAKHDAGVWGLAAFVGASLLSTCFSLTPVSSVWGLGGYYGGLALVVLTAAAYCAVRSFAHAGDLDFLWLGIGVTSAVVVVLYVLNIFNIDLIGAYENTAVVERAQFFSTLGQKDFNAQFFSVSLPLVFYAFLSAGSGKRAAFYAVPALFGALALAVVDAEGLTLGLVAAVLLLICQRSFTTQTLRRMALIGIAFFGWAAWMQHMRSTVYTQGGTSLLAKFGAPQWAVPGVLVCGALWFVCFFAAKKTGGELPLYRLGRVIAAVAAATAVGLFALANLWSGFPSLGASLDGLLVFNDDWGTYRGTAWRAAFGAWADAPLGRKLVGYGPGTMHTAVAAWAGEGITARMKTFYAAHNEYLEQLLTTGVLGLAAWLTFVAAHLKRGLQNWAKPGVAGIVLALVSYLAHAVVSIRVSMVFPLVMLLFALLAALCAPAGEPAPQPAAKKPPAPKRKKQEKTPPPAAAPNPAWRCAKLTAAAVAAMWVCGGASRILFAFLY